MKIKLHNSTLNLVHASNEFVTSTSWGDDFNNLSLFIHAEYDFMQIHRQAREYDQFAYSFKGRDEGNFSITHRDKDEILVQLVRTETEFK